MSFRQISLFIAGPVLRGEGQRSQIVRFIEFMPIGADDGRVNDKAVPLEKIIFRLEF